MNPEGPEIVVQLWFGVIILSTINWIVSSLHLMMFKSIFYFGKWNLGFLGSSKSFSLCLGRFKILSVQLQVDKVIGFESYGKNPSSE
jgi:hypothetical protein